MEGLFEKLLWRLGAQRIFPHLKHGLGPECPGAKLLLQTAHDGTHQWDQRLQHLPGIVVDVQQCLAEGRRCAQRMDSGVGFGTGMGVDGKRPQTLKDQFAFPNGVQSLNDTLYRLGRCLAGQIRKGECQHPGQAGEGSVAPSVISVASTPVIAYSPSM